MNFILYNSKCNKTGEQLKNGLGISGGVEPPREKTNVLIRWGSLSKVSSMPGLTINKLMGVKCATDKELSILLLRRAGINSPEIYSKPFPPSESLKYPLFGRKKNHHQGKDIQLFMQPSDLNRTDASTYDFLVSFVPSEKEYRIHVFGEQILSCEEKRRPTGDSYKTPCFIRNADNGWVFVDVTPSEELKLLSQYVIKLFKLDFGAIDILKTRDTFSVLEVNTAPTLGPNNLQKYISSFNSRISEFR